MMSAKLAIGLIGLVIAVAGWGLSILNKNTPYWSNYVAVGIVGNIIQIVGLCIQK